MTDWLARKRGGVIDFRLPGDPSDLPSKIERARIMEYYGQVNPGLRGDATKRQKPRVEAPGRSKPAPAAPKTAPEEGDDWFREM